MFGCNIHKTWPHTPKIIKRIPLLENIYDFGDTILIHTPGVPEIISTDVVFENFQKILVAVANGQTTVLQLSPGGVLFSNQLDIEPIVPMGSLTSQLGCSVEWEGENLEVIYPSKREAQDLVRW